MLGFGWIISMKVAHLSLLSNGVCLGRGLTVEAENTRSFSSTSVPWFLDELATMVSNFSNLLLCNGVQITFYHVSSISCTESNVFSYQYLTLKNFVLKCVLCGWSLLTPVTYRAALTQYNICKFVFAFNQSSFELWKIKCQNIFNNLVLDNFPFIHRKTFWTVQDCTIQAKTKGSNMF